MTSKSEATALLNKYGNTKTPFNFYCDFLAERWCIQRIDQAPETAFQLAISEEAKKYQLGVDSQQVLLEKFPIPYQEFKLTFDKILHQINIGNSFLTNLTFQTPIEIDLSLIEIFERSTAKYKLHVPDQFVVFSPETFVRTQDDNIYSYPMKGTIDASLPKAEETILTDPKEIAEHVTIVDLIRNDLSHVADEVSVSRFRYIEEIKTKGKTLLQVSSEVKGKLETGWQKDLGYILCKLLPAGSISGAPKAETLRIITEIEDYDRNFYTGICGQFDGENLDTGVMIRFIKEDHAQFLYCSGGGITAFSDPEKEYQEMINKIYLPLQ
ncbi:MAG: aminodeoxychorismate synthase component I [Cyclobacteriaceae bacterium]